ncbi:MAG: UbiD family decarboxylase [Candidatus Binatia bacterium]
MARAEKARTSERQTAYQGLRDWIEQVDRMGELLKLSGAHWDEEMGAITHMLTEKSKGTAPAILFDEVPGYPKGFRTLYGQLSSMKRIALTLGLPLEYERKFDLVKAYYERMQSMTLMKPKFIDKGPILDHVIEGDAVDVLKFPVPRHHELDKARYIGTADCVITKDPDSGWLNLGAYRCQVYDGKTIGCQITEGKHGRIQRDKYFERGQSMKVVVLVGQDPLLYLLSSSPLPKGISEYDFAGGIRGEPIEVIRGPYTGFPIPADAEIAIEAEAVPGQVRPEGPFGEWMGYYSDDVVPRPCLNVKTILYRDDPILTCAPQHKPVDETGLLKGIAGAAEVWKSLEACGIPEILGVWNHEAGPATRFTAIQIRQRYPGHARQVLHVASSCQGGAYNGKWTVVVDDDIDASDLDQVLWAMCTRFDPVTDIDIIQKAWSSGRDPMFLPGNFNNRILIDACVPYDRKLKGKFPPVVDVSPELRAKLKAKWGKLLASS